MERFRQQTGANEKAAPAKARLKLIYHQAMSLMKTPLMTTR